MVIKAVTRWHAANNETVIVDEFQAISAETVESQTSWANDSIQDESYVNECHDRKCNAVNAAYAFVTAKPGVCTIPVSAKYFSQ